MPTIKIDINKITEEQVDLIVDYLRRGQVMAYPTDTVYGLGCDANNAEAIKKINIIKGQRDNRPFLVLMSDLAMVKKFCLINEEQEKYLASVWPGPTTVIMENKKNLPAELTGGQETLAVRLPKNEFLIKIISKAGWPIVSTSLNKTGQPPLSSLKNLGDFFETLPDLALDAGTIAGAKPSRLVDLRDIKNIKVIRE